MDRSLEPTTWEARAVTMLLGFSKNDRSPEGAGDDVPSDVESRAPLSGPSPSRQTAVPGEVAAAASRATERLECWFNDHFDTLWRFAARLGVPRQHVDDVVQEVFITASRRASSIAAGSERRFLISATIKISANQRRRRARQLDRPALIENEPDRSADGAERLDQKRLLRLLYLALDELSDQHRSVFVLHELEGYTVPEIAELLGVPEGTAASRLGRARQAFAKAAAPLRARWLKGDAG